MNYAYWAALVSGDDFAGTRTLIDTHDLLTLGMKMKQALAPYLASPPFDAGKVPPELVREDFFRIAFSAALSVIAIVFAFLLWKQRGCGTPAVHSEAQR